MSKLRKLDEEKFKGKPPEGGYSVLDDDVWIAGGSIRRWYSGEESDTGDIDIFTKTEASFNDVLALLVEAGFKEKETTENSVTLELDGLYYQVCKRHFKDVDELIDDFDYCHCQFVWTKTGVYATFNAINSVENKELVINRVKGTEVSSLKRAFKFHKQGYSVSNETLMSLMEAIRAIGETDMYGQVDSAPLSG